MHGTFSPQASAYLLRKQVWGTCLIVRVERSGDGLRLCFARIVFASSTVFSATCQVVRLMAGQDLRRNMPRTTVSRYRNLCHLMARTRTDCKATLTLASWSAFSSIREVPPPGNATVLNVDYVRTASSTRVTHPHKSSQAERSLETH